MHTHADSEGHLNIYAMVQYYLNGPVIPHGNSSHSKAFFRTKETTKQECKQIANDHTPSQAVMIMTNQCGGK